ncbi:MAG TPA: phage holin family protein [Pseudonocardia sp.]|jgi:hypothetical protein|uniref:phage holin family protein n=1 Tax=Pseudonocardia sp. TaxID=60912 RepID=UPI002B77BE5E|nr:phage holin family protein [Pseudonocardia sp.]HTF49301.1 phage holin family protein [Pseudonocardia sp.]
MTEMRPGGLRELSTGELVAQMSAQVSRLVRDELRLAQAELRQKGKQAIGSVQRDAQVVKEGGRREYR